ncbi:MAG: tetratricopeptide repeat protein [Myxococcota bacterium]
MPHRELPIGPVDHACSSPTRRLWRGRWAAAVLGAVLTACAGGPTQQEVERSAREFRLAATLRDEGNTAAAVEHLRKALALDPDNAHAHALLGFIRMERGELELAREHLRRAEKLESSREGVGSGRTVAEVRNWLGIVLIELGRHDEAVEVLRASASDLANTAPHLAWGNLGMAYFEKKEYDQALEALEQAVRVQPRFCVGYFRMGRVHFEQGALEKADEALTRALEADDVCGERYQAAYRLRGEVRARLGRRSDAIHDFERCVELEPDTEDAAACRRLLGGD